MQHDKPGRHGKVEQTRHIKTIPNKYVEPKKPKLRNRQDEIIAFRVLKVVIGEVRKKKRCGIY